MMAKKKVKKHRRRAKLVSEGGITSRPVDGKLSADEKVRYEREIRRYVRDSGGFRKGLADADKTKCNKLLKKMKRKGVTRDKKIVVPGLDKPTVAGMLVT